MTVQSVPRSPEGSGGASSGLGAWGPPHPFSSQPSSSPEPDRGRGGMAFHRLIRDLKTLFKSPTHPTSAHEAYKQNPAQPGQAVSCWVTPLQKHCGWIPRGTGALSAGF